MSASEYRAAALKRGVDELQSRLDWVLRDRPRALANARREYVRYCLRLYRRMAREVKRT